MAANSTSSPVRPLRLGLAHPGTKPNTSGKELALNNDMRNNEFASSDYGPERTADVSPHRCDGMMPIISDPRFLIDYIPEEREFVLWRLDDVRHRPGIRIVVPLDFCPWCGQKLPASLAEARIHEMLREAGIDEDDLEDVFQLVDEAPAKFHGSSQMRV